VELKAKLFQEMQPRWSQYSGGYPLTLNNIVMRDKNWVEIHPRTPDRDVINSPSFYKEAKHGPPIFKGGKAIVHLHIPNDVYGSYEDWVEQREMEQLEPDVLVC